MDKPDKAVLSKKTIKEDALRILADREDHLWKDPWTEKLPAIHPATFHGESILQGLYRYKTERPVLSECFVIPSSAN